MSSIGTGLLPAGSGTATGGPDPGMASEGGLREGSPWLCGETAADNLYLPRSAKNGVNLQQPLSC